MQKVWNFLEGYVEWIVLGLGGLFLLYMIFAYVISPPVSVTIGGQALLPGEVDSYVATNSAEVLKKQYEDPKTIQIPVEPFTETFQKAISNEGRTAVTLDDPPLSAPVIMEGAGELEQRRKKDEGSRDGIKVTALPTMPAAVIEEVGFGESSVNVPDPKALAEAKNVADVPLVARDVRWATVFASISPDEITVAFDKSRIPDELRTTLFVGQVELMREEQVGDKWGHSTLIKVLPIHPVEAAPSGNNRDEANRYQEWAMAHTDDIIRPTFYQWADGDPWGMPSMIKAKEGAATPVAVPAAGAETPAQKKRREALEAKEAKRAEDKRKADARRAQQPGTPRTRQPANPGMGPGGGGYGRPAPKDNDRPVQPQFPPMVGPNGPIGPMGGMGPMGGPIMPNPNGQQNPAQPGAIPGGIQGMFNPTDLKDNLIIWAHDETVQPGKVYRYKIRYTLKNPVYDSNRTDPPELAKQFTITSEWSEWSEEFAFPVRTNVFVAGVAPGARSMKLDVFASHAGKRWKHTFEVTPGDLVGELVQDGQETIDFRTSWTVVDLPTDSSRGETSIMLVDEEGNVMRRDFSSDRQNPEYQKQLTEAQTQVSQR